MTRTDFDDVAGELGAVGRSDERALYRPRYNIAPTDQHWIVRTKLEERQMLAAKWGLVNSWAPMRRAPLARSTLAARPRRTRAFRDAFESRRCAVPADGFFEWVGPKEARRPVWFHAPDDGLILFAGLYESWRDPAMASEWMRTFTILTTTANETVAPVHDRMPVILRREQLDRWLFVPTDEKQRPAYASDVRGLLAPASSSVLIPTEVSTRANSVKNDDPGVLEPALDRETVETPRLL